MENLASCRRQLEALRHRVKAQTTALGLLCEAFTQEAECLRRLDQAGCLDALRAKVIRQAAVIQQMETIESCAFTKATLASGLVRFGLGTLAGLLLQKEEHPLSIGARLAEDDFTPREPFGTVMVAIGAGGVPDDVRVIPVSRYAREDCASETAVIAALEAKGYRLMGPGVFLRLIDEAKTSVLKGDSSLPTAQARFILKPARRQMTTSGTWPRKP